jgi:predicted extracellular nuclease
MRICSFNVENLFQRAKALNLETWAKGRPALERYAKVSLLLNQVNYSAADKDRIAKLLTELGLEKSDDGHGFARLRQNRGTLLRRANGKIEIVASGRADWSGWLELKTEPVNELASQHIAKVINEVDADIVGVVEAENRIALRDFGTILRAVGATPYKQVMVIDGNDDRGIDVGIMTKSGYEITGIRSHVEDTDDRGTIFSRDCPEYTITTSNGRRLVVLVNHLKSKGYARPRESPDQKRTRQAKRVAQIYARLRQDGETRIAIVGDFNDFKGSAPLEPLLKNTDLRDISDHNGFDDEGLPGTYGRQGIKDKFDYILLSPELFGRVTNGGVCRLGVWGLNEKPPKKWKIFDTLTKPREAASDHAAIYADLDL